MNKILQEDLFHIIDNFDLSALKDKTVLITGATGLLGYQMTLLLLTANEVQHNNTTVIATSRNLTRLQDKFKEWNDNSNLILKECDIRQKIDCTENIDYIIHGASITQSKMFVEQPVDTILTTVEGTRNILDLAQQKDVKGVVYLSSMEVFGQVLDDKKLSESDYGYIDLANPRSSYSEGKRMAECLCVAYAKQFGVPVKMVRLAQTVGPGFKYDDTRMVVQFARAAIENHDIVLLTEGKSKCTPIYARDALTAILTVLLDGEPGQAYNAANVAAFASVREIAETVAHNIAQDKIKVRVELNDAMQYPPAYILNLDTSKLEALGWKAHVSLKEMYERLIQSLKEI